MKKILIVGMMFSGLLISSCKKNITDLNIDPKSPTVVPSGPLFTNAELNLSDMMASTNVNVNNFRLFVQYWSETTYTDETNYDLNQRSIPDRWFASLYRDVIRDLTESTNILASEVQYNAVQKANRVAINDILIVYAYYHLITTFGNVPFTDALDINKIQPKYDNAATIFNAIASKLDGALGAINTTESSYGTADIILGGDMDKWVMFGNCLKLRMAMLIADVDAPKAATMATQAAAKVISSNSENLSIQYLSAPPNTNPVWEDIIQSGRHDFVAANTIVDSMTNRNDPRIPLFFEQSNGMYVGQPYGTGGGSFSDPSLTISSPTYPHTFFSYSEMEFLKAEGIERGLALGGTAEDHYNNAVTASIEEWGGTTVQATTYLAQPNVAYSTAGGGWKQKIGVQSWIALYNRGYDAWTQWRRLDFPMLQPGPEAISDVPVRMTYPVLEQNLNKANYEAASSAIGGDKVSTKLWFDKF